MHARPWLDFQYHKQAMLYNVTPQSTHQKGWIGRYTQRHYRPIKLHSKKKCSRNPQWQEKRKQIQQKTGTKRAD